LPKVGDVLSFEIGKDKQGRPVAIDIIIEIPVDALAQKLGAVPHVEN
jgi:hypothetical protein